jgi:hypothetical protein
MPRFFTVRLQVEEVALGPVMRQLNNMPGVAKFNLDLEDMKYTAPNGKASHQPRGKRMRRGAYELRGTDYLVQLLSKADKPLRTGELQELFSKNGRGKSIASAIHALRKDGLVETTPAGYMLTKKMKDRLRHRKGA